MKNSDEIKKNRILDDQSKKLAELLNAIGELHGPQKVLELLLPYVAQILINLPPELVKDETEDFIRSLYQSVIDSLA